MHDLYTYHVQVRGQVNERDVNAMGPLQVTAMQEDTATTLFTVRADQAGLIGLLRHLHGRGVVLLSVTRER